MVVLNLRLSGNIPVYNDWFIIVAKGMAITGHKRWSDFVEIPLCPVLHFFFSLYLLYWTSSVLT